MNPFMAKSKSEDIAETKSSQRSWFARGKLLLTGEYVVLHGATALALPTRQGQHLKLKESPGSELIWKSYDHEGKIWFEGKFDLMGFDVTSTSDEATARSLRKLLRAACRDNGDFLSQWKKYTVETRLEFPRDWGLGSSSTLVYLVSEWAEANPFLVLFDSFEGSGYDVACAGADGPILYELGEDALHYESCDFHPSFQDELYFVHLGKKVDSQEEVKKFLKGKKPTQSIIERVSEITGSMCKAGSLADFEKLIDEHNRLMEGVLPLEPPGRRFPDYWGKVKPLGAWGGDFVMVTSERGEDITRAYFNEKGLPVLLPYREMIH